MSAPDRQAVARLRKKLTAGLVGVAVAMTNEAKGLATRHLDTGERRNSITHAVLPSGGVLWGLPRNLKNVSLETGMKPHWVPARYAGVWMQRNKVGISYRSRFKGDTKRGRKYKTARAVALGVFVGGPGSSLQQGPGQPGGMQFAGKGKRVFRRWSTRGGTSPYLDANKVGHPILQPVVRERLRGLAAAAFTRGYRRG